jgi:hypothetical protein
VTPVIFYWLRVRELRRADARTALIPTATRRSAVEPTGH